MRRDENLMIDILKSILDKGGEGICSVGYEDFPNINIDKFEYHVEMLIGIGYIERHGYSPGHIVQLTPEGHDYIDDHNRLEDVTIIS